MTVAQYVFVSAPSSLLVEAKDLAIELSLLNLTVTSQWHRAPVVRHAEAMGKLAAKDLEAADLVVCLLGPSEDAASVWQAGYAHGQRKATVAVSSKKGVMTRPVYLEGVGVTFYATWAALFEALTVDRKRLRTSFQSVALRKLT